MLSFCFCTYFFKKKSLSPLRYLSVFFLFWSLIFLSIDSRQWIEVPSAHFKATIWCFGRNVFVAIRRSICLDDSFKLKRIASLYFFLYAIAFRYELNNNSTKISHDYWYIHSSPSICHKNVDVERSIYFNVRSQIFTCSQINTLFIYPTQFE